MKSNLKSYLLSDVIMNVIDNRGKTPPRTIEPTSYELLEVNSLRGNSKHPTYGVVKKYVSKETYENWFRKGHPKKGDVLISTVGSIGEVAISEGRGCIAQNIVALQTNESILSSEYLYYLFTSHMMKNVFNALNISSVQPSIKVPHLLAQEIQLPPLATQLKIIGVLKSLDSKITNNKSMNQTLEKIAQRIFKSWFIDFDPVKANKEGVPFDGLSPEIQALFPSEFESSELGMIPKGWNIEPLSSLININPKRTIKKGTVTHHIDMKVLPTSSMSIDGVSSKEFKSGTKFINHDTLLARITPCLENGKTAYVNCIPGNDIAWGSTEFIVMNPKNEYIREYAYLLARSDELRAYAIKNMTGTSGRQRVSGALIGEYQIPQPDENVIKAFHKITASLFAKISSNTENSVALEKIRDLLLPKLISGQISVGEAKQEFAEAV